MRFAKVELLPLAVATDTAIAVLEGGQTPPPREREHALIMLRQLRSKALRSAREPEEAAKTT